MPTPKRRARRTLCCAREHHARGLCRRQYDHWRRTGELDPAACAGPAPAHLTMCGCLHPVVDAGCVCRTCSHPNLAALLEARPAPSIVTPPVLQAAAAAGRPIVVL